MQKEISLNSGYKVPVIGFGTWQAKPNVVGHAVEQAVVESGYHHIDCAAIYGNEKEIGEALQNIFYTGTKREELFITSKLWNTEHHPDNVEAACRQTLKDLQLDYLDLYLIHWGIPFKHGKLLKPLSKLGIALTESVPIYQTWAAMEKLVKKGLVKSIGVANFTVPMLMDLLTYAKIPPAMNQIELHPYNSQFELVKYCHRNNIAVTAYSPLGTPGGLEKGDPILLDDSTIKKIAKAHKKTPAQILLNWAVARNTIPIPKSTTPSRIQENIEIFDFELTSKETEAIDELNCYYRFVDPINFWGIPYFD